MNVCRNSFPIFFCRSFTIFFSVLVLYPNICVLQFLFVNDVIVDTGKTEVVCITERFFCTVCRNLIFFMSHPGIALSFQNLQSVKLIKVWFKTQLNALKKVIVLRRKLLVVLFNILSRVVFPEC